MVMMRGDPLEQLIGMVRSLRLESSPIGDAVGSLAMRPTERSMRHAQKLMRVVAPAYYEAALRPDPCMSRERDLEGDFPLGHLRDGTMFGLQAEDLMRHCLIAGQSGTGKSWLLRSIFLRARELGAHIIYCDRKGDAEHLARDGVLSVPWVEDRVNFLEPPDPAVDLVAWRNDFATAFCENQGLLHRGNALFLLGMDQVYRDFGVYDRWREWRWEEMRFPTLHDLLEVFTSDAFVKRTRPGMGRQSLHGIVDKLESLCVRLGPVVRCCRGISTRRLFERGVAISYCLEGLPVEMQNLLVTDKLLRYQHLFRALGPRNRLNCIFLLDESKGFFGRRGA